MRQRAISAAILVPVLLIVLAIGGPVLAAAVALVTALAAIEAFRLLQAAGYPPLPALGVALALAVVADAAFPDVLEGSGLLLGAVGIVLVAVAAFTRLDPHDGLAAWMATIFGALYVSLLVVRAAPRPRCAGPAALGAAPPGSGRSAAGSCSSSWRSGRTTRAPTSSERTPVGRSS